MSKNRMVDTIFWEDHYTANLDPLEKLLFLYFLTNTSTNICGVYQITLKKIVVETGIEREILDKILARFESENKIFYRNGWIGIKNFIKHQNQNSPQVKKGIERELELVPDELRELMKLEGMDTLSHLTKPNLTKLNLTEKKFSALGAAVLKAFEDVDRKNSTYYSNKTQRAAADFLVEEHGLEKVLGVIAVLNETNGLPYFPAINSPNDLKEKWVKLENAMKRMKKENVTNGRGFEE